VETNELILKNRINLFKRNERKYNQKINEIRKKAEKMLDYERRKRTSNNSVIIKRKITMI